MITHYDLFAGIGGFSIALEEVFDEPIRHIFCEWESFPTAVLRRHWPDGEFWGDIAELVAHTDSQRVSDGLTEVQKADGKVPQRHNNAEPGDTDRLTNTNTEREGLQGQQHEAKTQGRHDQLNRSGSHQRLSSDFTIVTGGFPCQPFSHAGRRRGTADDRYQWPNMFAVIRHTKPEWVIAENVRGLVTWNEGMVLETVCADLESEGYEVQPFIIPAVAVGAPHRRDRVWIIANRDSAQVDTKYKRPVRLSSQRRHSLDVRQETTRQTNRQDGNHQHERRYPDWSRNWQEVAFATCDDSVDARLPYWLDYFIGREGEIDGTPNYKLTRQDLRNLRKNFQSEAFRTAFGRCYEIPETEILWKVLRQLPKGGEGEPERIQFGGSSFEEEYLRSVWEQPRFSRPSQKWEHHRKSADQHNDVMPELSQQATLELAKAWRYSWMVLGTLQTRAVETDEIKLSAAAHRKDSLKAYGNAIVPQVAMNIMQAIKETINSPTNISKKEGKV